MQGGVGARTLGRTRPDAEYRFFSSLPFYSLHKVRAKRAQRRLIRPPEHDSQTVALRKGTSERKGYEATFTEAAGHDRGTDAKEEIDKKAKGR